MVTCVWACVWACVHKIYVMLSLQGLAPPNWSRRLFSPPTGTSAAYFDSWLFPLSHNLITNMINNDTICILWLSLMMIRYFIPFQKVIRQSMCLFTSSKMKKVIEFVSFVQVIPWQRQHNHWFWSMLICLSFLYQVDSMLCLITPYFSSSWSI